MSLNQFISLHLADPQSSRLVCGDCFFWKMGDCYVSPVVVMRAGDDPVCNSYAPAVPNDMEKNILVQIASGFVVMAETGSGSEE